MKDYLKMEDAFPAARVGNEPVKPWVNGEYYVFYEMQAEYAAHAINSHDELVAMNRELLEVLKRVVFDLNELSNNSDGVIGLHRNGDIARWSSLRSCGFNEGWLLSIDEAEGTIEKMEGGAS